jgi:hypothetical protein
MNTRNVTLATIIKVFTALKAKIKFTLELDGKQVKLTSE